VFERQERVDADGDEQGGEGGRVIAEYQKIIASHAKEKSIPLLPWVQRLLLTWVPPKEDRVPPCHTVPPLKPRKPRKVGFMGWLKGKGGINIKDPNADTAGRRKKETGYTWLLTKNGRYLDTLVDEAIDEGYLLKGSTVQDFKDTINAHIMSAGKPTIHFEDEKRFEGRLRRLGR
jgi:hypothetical protein